MLLKSKYRFLFIDYICHPYKNPLCVNIYPYTLYSMTKDSMHDSIQHLRFSFFLNLGFGKKTQIFLLEIHLCTSWKSTITCTYLGQCSLPSNPSVLYSIVQDKQRGQLVRKLKNWGGSKLWHWGAGACFGIIRLGN